jgi:glutaconate CoA-transferase, subunit B
MSGRPAAADRVAVADVMLAALAAEIRDGDVLGVGLGTPLAVAAGLLARATHAPGAHLLVGGAVDPDADLATCLGGATAVLGRTVGFVPHLDTMDMAERQAMTLQFLRPGQVDGRGAMNTSRIGPAIRPSLRFPGGLATADVPGLLPRLVVYLPRHAARSLPERVSCVTGAPGGVSTDRYSTRGVITLVTDKAVIDFADGQAHLRSIHPGVDREELAASTGFALAGLDDAVTSPGLDPEQAEAMARLDPGGLRAQEL